jgi:hypothetical protein
MLGPPSSMVCIGPAAAHPGDPVLEESAFADLRN